MTKRAIPFITTALGLIAVAASLPAQEVPPAVSTAAAGGGFDPSPRHVTAVLRSVDGQHRKLFLVPSSGPEIEMSVPSGVPIESPGHAALGFEDLRSSSTLRVRYHPLTLEAMQIQVLRR